MDEDQAEVEEKSVIPGRNATETEIKHAAAIVLHDAGMGPRAISEAIERTPNHVCAIVAKKKKESFSHPRRVKAASKLLDEVMQGYHGKDERVKASDALRAVEIVGKAAGELEQDRGPGSVSQTFIQINMDAFRHKM